MKPELGGDSHFSGTTNFALPSRVRKGHITRVPFTAKELKSMYGLTVEEALAKGFNEDWYNKKKAASEAGTSLAAKEKSQIYDITQSEECQMENIRTRLSLVLCLMESPLFAETDNNLKLEMLAQLLYDQPLDAEAVDTPKADKPRRPGGRPRKTAAEKKDGEGA